MKYPPTNPTFEDLCSNTEHMLGGLVSHSPAGLNIDHDKLLALFNSDELASHAGPFGLTIADMRQPDAPLVAVSDGFLELTGYERDEILGRNCRFLQGPDTDPTAVAYIRRAIETCRPLVVTLLNYRKDGSTFWNRLAMNPIRDQDDQVVFFTGIQTDVTALREAEDQFLQTHQMIEDVLRGPSGTPSKQVVEQVELADRLATHREGELRDLLATLTHELRRPALSISGLLKIVRRELDETLSEDQLDTMSLAIAESDRMKALIDALGELLIIEERELVELPAVVCEVMDLALSAFAGLRNNRGIEVTTKCTGQMAGKPVRFCSEQVVQALGHLIENAYLHGSTNDDPAVVVQSDVGTKLASISVQDNGPGIPERHHKRVFGLFSRLSSPAADPSGAGIGLAAVRRLMSRIGGTVELDSPEGKGCRFTLTFPIEVEG